MKMRAVSALLFLGLALVPPSGILTGCETVQLGDAPKDTTGTETGTATIAFTNRRETDAGVLTFNLYAARTELLASPIPNRILGKVGVQQTVTFSVPAGSWKLGYEDNEGLFHNMPVDTYEGSSQDWPVVVLTRDKTYQIVLETDPGGHTVWRNDLVQAD